MRRKMESVLLLTVIVGIGGDVVTIAFPKRGKLRGRSSDIIRSRRQIRYAKRVYRLCNQGPTAPPNMLLTAAHARHWARGVRQLEVSDVPDSGAWRSSIAQGLRNLGRNQRHAWTLSPHCTSSDLVCMNHTL
jgi:hypothetical protein